MSTTLLQFTHTHTHTWNCIQTNLIRLTDWRWQGIEFAMSMYLQCSPRITFPTHVFNHHTSFCYEFVDSCLFSWTEFWKCFLIYTISMNDVRSMCVTKKPKLNVRSFMIRNTQSQFQLGKIGQCFSFNCRDTIHGKSPALHFRWRP